jgi:tripartite motif-containing protein 71
VWAIDTRGDRIEDFPADLATMPRVQSYGRSGSAVGQLNYPEGADVAADGTVYVADTRNNRIQKFDPASGSWSVLQGEELQQPMGVAVAGSTVFVADTQNNRVVKLSSTGSLLASYTTGLKAPEGLDVAPDGTVWVADTQNSRVVHLSAELVDLGDGFGARGTGSMQFDRPHDVALGNGDLYVADTYNNRVQVFDLGGAAEPPAPFNPTYDKQLSDPGGHAPVYPAGVGELLVRRELVRRRLRRQPRGDGRPRHGRRHPGRHDRVDRPARSRARRRRPDLAMGD